METINKWLARERGREEERLRESEGEVRPLTRGKGPLSPKEPRDLHPRSGEPGSRPPPRPILSPPRFWPEQGKGELLLCAQPRSLEPDPRHTYGRVQRRGQSPRLGERCGAQPSRGCES